MSQDSQTIGSRYIQAIRDRNGSLVLSLLRENLQRDDIPWDEFNMELTAEDHQWVHAQIQKDTDEGER